MTPTVPDLPVPDLPVPDLPVPDLPVPDLPTPAVAVADPPSADRSEASYRDAGAEHTHAEIHQQPRVWRELAADLGSRREAVDGFLRPLLEDPALRVVLTGAGTSAFSGELVAPALSRLLGRRVEAIASTDLVSSPLEQLTPDVPTLLVSFARSGDSPESVAAARLADQVLTRAHHLVLTCNPDGALAADRRADSRSLVVLMPPDADDQGFAMTSSFTSMTLAALLTLGGAAYERDVERAAAAAEDLLSRHAGTLRQLAATPVARIVYLGSGSLAGLARESALKMLELTAGEVVTMADTALGFRHGPKSVLTADTLVVVYLSNDEHTRAYDLDIVDELSHGDSGARVLVVNGGPPVPGDATVVDLAGTGELLDPLLALPAVLVAQLLGLHRSLALRHTPDNPFPSGSVNRVVRGVTVHDLRLPPVLGADRGAGGPPVR